MTNPGSANRKKRIPKALADAMAVTADIALHERERVVAILDNYYRGAGRLPGVSSQGTLDQIADILGVQRRA